MGPQLKNQDGNYTYRVTNINKEVSLPLKKFVCKKNEPALKAHDFRYKPFLYFDLNYKGKKRKEGVMDGLQMSLQRQHLLLSFLKTLSFGLAGVRTHDIPLRRLALIRLG